MTVFKRTKAWAKQLHPKSLSCKKKFKFWGQRKLVAGRFTQTIQKLVKKSFESLSKCFAFTSNQTSRLMNFMKIKVKNIFKSFRKSVEKPHKSGKMVIEKDICKNKEGNSASLAKNVLNFMHRFFVLIVRWILSYAYGGKGKSMPPINDLTLLESATSLAHKIRTKKITSVEVVKSFIGRIKQVNSLLNCVVDERFSDALKEAEEADALIASEKYSEDELAKIKPFLGVPISTKDCIMVKGMLNTSGLYRRRGIRGPEDADCIALIRNAGAIPFALTNVSECCMWWESSNPVHGRTRNPYDSNRIVGGSSGGEGCIQAAAASPFGIGSDIGGSIRIPAFFNGIFGHKPTKFVVSNKGQFPMPFSKEQDSFLGIGPMCRYSVDLKPMLKIMAGDKADLLKLDEPVNLANVKFFYQENDGGGHLISPVERDIRDGLRRAVRHVETALKVKPQKIQLDKFRKSAAIWFANMKDSSGVGFDSQLANLQGKINAYTELLKWTICNSNHTFVGLMTAIVEKNGVKYDSDKYHYLVKKRDELLAEVQELLGDNGVLLYPTHPTVAPYHNEPIARALNFAYTGIINVLGLPATSVPLGIGSEGLPIGIQVIANFHQDRLCLAVASELERAFGGWVPPEITA